MGLTDRLANRLFGPAIDRLVAQKATKYPAWLLARAGVEKFNIPNLTLPEKQAELYQRLSWVAIAVGHVARAAASVPFEVKREMGEDEEGIVNHPFERLLKRPNPSVSRFEFLESLLLYYQLTGNAYVWLNRLSENQPPGEMWIIPSHHIEPVPDGRMYLDGYLYDPGDGQKMPLPSWQIMHFKRFNPFSRYLGMSPVEALATVAVGDMKMQQWNTDFFGENNARMPGALTFADPIPDPEWEKIKEDAAEASKTRNMLMMRNTGAGGVNWVAMAMTQKDMEFLAAREFNKSEIYDMYAPGLNQWLNPNTTDGNSKNGRDAFFELGIAPVLEAMGQKITNDVLPMYADDLVGAFEDVRPKDRALLLQEQEAFAKVHTIDEIRAEYYQAKELGDERGKLIPVELGKIGAVDADLPGRDDVAAANEPPEPAPRQADEEEDEAAAKTRERDIFRRFAQKRIDEGKPEKIAGFSFEHLDADEQAAVKAEFIAPEPDPILTLTEQLKSAVDALRSMPYAEPVEAVE